MSLLTSVLHRPALRLVIVALVFLGMHNASLYPYQSLIAIDRMGMSKQGFSLMLVLASTVAVASSVMFGIIGDQVGKRRRIAKITALASTIGIALMLWRPGLWVMVLCHGILLPIASSLYGQIFALAGLSVPEAGQERDTILSTVRASMSISFLAMLVFWTFAFGAGLDVMAVYLSGGIASLVLSGLTLLGWPRDGSTAVADAPKREGLGPAFKALAAPAVLLRVICLGATNSAGGIYFILISLVFEASPLRGASDVALFVGLVAGWEVPAMLLIPRLAHRLPRSVVIAGCALLYAVFLLAMPVLSDTRWLWGLTILAGVGGTGFLTVPIVYYQDMLSGRPGAASALLALQKLGADVTAAAVFAIGSALGGFETVAAMGAAVSLTGAVTLVVADRKRRVHHPA